MLQGINSLNFNLSDGNDKYLLEALANLGQRYSLKGDGVSIGSIDFKHLIDAAEQYTSNGYIGKIFLANSNEVSMGIVAKNNLSTPITGTVKSLSNLNYQVSGSDDIISTSIEETELDRLTNAFMYSDQYYMVFSVLEHTADVDHPDDDEERYTCQKYDKYTNELVSAIRILKLNDAVEVEKGEHAYSILFISKIGEDSSVTKYKFNRYIAILDSDWNPTTNPETAISLTLGGIAANIALIAGDQGNASFTPESVLSKLYEILDPQNSESKFKKIFESGAKRDKTTGSFSVDTTANSDWNAAANQCLSYLQYFNYDRTYIYTDIKEYYSTNYFASDGTTATSRDLLIRKVLKGLLNLVYNSSKSETELYVPLDYVFEYAYNTNDPAQIYFSTHDIVLRYGYFKDEDDKKKLVSALDDPAGIICPTKGSERIYFFNYSIEYEDTKDVANVPKNIYGIHVKKHYELPYINEFGYWVINGIATEIYAKGKDAGNPNIIVVETSSLSSTPNILTMADQDYLTSLYWTKVAADIKFPQKYSKATGSVTEVAATTLADSNIITKSGKKGVSCRFTIPSLATTNPKALEEHIEKLKYAIIINIARIDSIEGYESTSTPFSDLVRDIYGTNGRLSSIWTLQPDSTSNTGYSFKLVETLDGWAADFNFLSNTDNTVWWAINNFIQPDSDNYMFTHVVFDDANKQSKNNVSLKEYVYPVIKNRPTIEYGSNIWNNEYNMAIQYLNTIDGQWYTEDREPYMSYSYIINGVGQTGNKRYFDSWYDNRGASSTTNGLYTYALGENVFSYLDYVPSLLNHSIPIFETSEVLLKDQNVINRTNIMSFDSDGRVFYSYLGTRYDVEDKSYLVLGTASNNVNLGSYTMTTYQDPKTLTKQRQFNIDFENTRISTYAYVGNDAIFEHDTITYGTSWHRYDIDGTTYWLTEYRPVGKFNKKVMLLNTDSMNYDGKDMFIATFIPENYSAEQNSAFQMYIGDAVNLECLMKTVMPTVNRRSVEVTSNKEVITIDYLPVALKISTAKQTRLGTNPKILSDTVNGLDIDTIYYGTPLSISYYITRDDNVKMHIEEDDLNYSTGIIQKIKENYSSFVPIEP